MYKRLIKEQIKASFFKGKVIIISGARQVGKTTLAKDILNELELDVNIKSFNCDYPTDRDLLSGKDLEFLEKLIGNAKIIFIDEGQKAETIGQTLKILVDHYKNRKQILVTGSSSFNLLEKTQEALTGRKYIFNLFPLSLEEIYPDKNFLKMHKEINEYLVFGNYPDIVKQESFEEKKELLKELASSYLYKDILEYQKIKSPEILTNLLKALALQIGSEVSYSELSNLLKIDKITVEKYIGILENNFIIFRLPPYFKRKRREISKLRKIYFCDLGIRNAVINNMNFINDRNDAGALWENFLAVERLKFQKYHKIYSNNYFWRTYDGAEVDWIEERDGKLFGFEFKWNDKKKNKKAPAGWIKYKEASYKTITPKELSGFVI